jgi:SAM-dependent methyltransferase
MNAFQRCEYVTLRLIRRFVFNERSANRLARWLPYYAPSVGEDEPMRIVSDYVRGLAEVDFTLDGKRVLEIGTGRTNAVGYGLIGAGAGTACLLEPLVAFDAQRDAALRAASPSLDWVNQGRVRRVSAFDEIEPSSIDLVLSNSVLEHVRQIDALFAGCRRVLVPGGAMLHRVDYRDHFFKYPYGFLTFSEHAWSRWLDPGDLPRWRLSDHVLALRHAGFTVEVFNRESMPETFARVRPHLAERFAEASPDVDVTRATLFVRIAA